MALREMIDKTVRDHDWQVHELNIQPDHVHALIQLDPRTSVARCAQLLKGSSSFQLRKGFPELERFFWGDSL